MKQPEHYDLVVLYCKVYGIRESPKQTAPDSVMNLLIKQRIASDFSGVSVEHPNKFLAKAQ